MCWEILTAQETPWCNGKTDSECANGVKSSVATQGCALV